MKNNNQEILKNISEALSLFSEQIISAISTATKVIKEKTISYLQALFEEIPNLSPERKLELEQFCETLLGYGWILFDFLPMDIYHETFDSVDAADKYMEEYCTPENIKKIFETLSSNSYISHEDIANIKKCFNVGAYKACCSLIMTNLEHYILSDYDISDNALLKQPAIQKIKELNKEINDSKFTIFTYLHNYSLYLGLNEVFSDIKDIKNVDDTNFVIPSRHCLQHGYSKRRYTKKDCLFLLLLLFGFIQQKCYIIKKKAKD